MSRGIFSPREIVLAIAGALGVQAAFFALLALAGDSRGIVREELTLESGEVAIAVQPILDERPLLKLGSKVKQRLPDMWKKREPVPVQRFEERSAPSESAKDDVAEIPQSELADKDHAAPDEDDKLIDELEQQLDDPEEELEETPLAEEGEADGVAEGTETDPLKARQIDKYRLKIAGWFSNRFSLPKDGIPCDVLKSLSTGVSVQVGSDRRIVSFQLSSPSGNPIFDAKVTSTIQSLVGQQLPPPPPLYPDILGSVVSPRLSGRGASCKSSVTAPPKKDKANAEESPETPSQPSPSPAEETPAPAP